MVAQTAGRLHPAEVFRALHPCIERNAEAILVCDGGEFAQWGQSLLPVRRRLVNGVAGAIGSSLSFVLSARLLEPAAAGVCRARRRHDRLPHFRVRDRGATPAAVRGGARQRCLLECRAADPAAEVRPRAHARLRVLEARYDQVVAALGGHGELVETPPT